MKNHPLRIIPLGGLGEVGRNMMVYEYGNDLIVVDTGLMFPDNGMLGIDYIIPDIEYLRQNKDRIRAIFITHGHEDHIGAIHHVLAEIQAPIYATKLTAGLIEVKLNRRGMANRAEIHVVSAGDKIVVGAFSVELFHVCHSIPDAVGLGITTPAGLVVHSGDYKFDHTPVDDWPTDYAKLAEFSQRGVLALLADSTNAVNPGWTPSERVIEEGFDQVFRKAKGRILVATFASLISRMQQVAEATERSHRKLAFVGTSMVDNMKMARSLGYITFPETLVVSMDEALNMKDRDVVIMCTGSQGEPSSILGRLSNGTYRGLEIKSGDTVVMSSHPIPGNEEAVYGTINRLFERGADVVYEAIAPVHVSGHASQEEMKLLLQLVRPKYVIPIHGELRMLKRHAFLAGQVGVADENIAIIQNGQIVEFENGKMTIAGRVPVGSVFIDSSGGGDVDPEVMRERELLAREGIIMVQVAVDRYSGGIIGQAEVTSRGLAFKDADAVMAGARRVIGDTLSRANGNAQKDLEQALGSYIYSETRRKPTIFISITRV
jgi:ribonuclease J